MSTGIWNLFLKQIGCILTNWSPSPNRKKMERTLRLAALWKAHSILKSDSWKSFRPNHLIEQIPILEKYPNLENQIVIIKDVYNPPIVQTKKIGSLTEKSIIHGSIVCFSKKGRTVEVNELEVDFRRFKLVDPSGVSEIYQFLNHSE